MRDGPVLEHAFAFEAHRTRMLLHVPHMPRPMPREQDLLHGAGDALRRDTFVADGMRAARAHS